MRSTYLSTVWLTAPLEGAKGEVMKVRDIFWMVFGALYASSIWGTVVLAGQGLRVFPGFVFFTIMCSLIFVVGLVQASFDL